MTSGSFHSATASEVLAGGAAAPSPAAAPGADVEPDLAGRFVAFGDAVAYSSALAALAGGAMTWAVGRAFASPTILRDAALVACGALLIYNVDRLRDLARDGSSSPERSAFVERNRPWLVAATGLAGLALLPLIATAPAASIALCLSIGAIGLLHRRLKQEARFKVAYVAAAWTAACVGLPWLAGVGAHGGGDGGASGADGAGSGAIFEAFVWSSLFVGSAVTANLIASNLRDGKCSEAGWARRMALFIARGLAIAAVSVAGIAPDSVAPLGWIPAAEAMALCFFRGSERFGHLAVDGALLVGAVIAICGARV